MIITKKQGILLKPPASPDFYFLRLLPIAANFIADLSLFFSLKVLSKIFNAGIHGFSTSFLQVK